MAALSLQQLFEWILVAINFSKYLKTTFYFHCFIDEVPEPELKELWTQLFRVMDDIHEGTRLAAQGSVMFLSKVFFKMFPYSSIANN